MHNSSGVDVKSNAQDNGPIGQILILQQISVGKNGLHSLTDWPISIVTSYNDKLNLYILLESEAKWQNTNLSVFGVKWSAPHNDLSWLNFDSSANEYKEKRFSLSYRL